MKARNFALRFCVFAAILCFALPAIAQKAKARPTSKASKQIIFAVLNDGRTLEPVAYVNRGKLKVPVNGGDNADLIAAFVKTYYKPGTIYGLIFGAANVGAVTVKSADPNSECSKNMAEVSSKTSKESLKGFVMGLATNAPERAIPAGTRRKPTSAEKTEIDSLVRAEFKKQKLDITEIHYQNLTALDVDNDGKVELVGSYWVATNKLTRGLLFFIASKGNNGKYAFGYHDYRVVEQENVMSGDIKNVDEGIYHELLLDAFDYDADGTSEIFTYVQSFEGSHFSVYHSSAGKWTRVFENDNYHCGY